MRKLIPLLLLCFILIGFGQFPNFKINPEFPNWSNPDSGFVDNVPPDSFTTAPIIAFIAPDSFSVTVVPSEVTAADIKEINIKLFAYNDRATWIGTSAPWGIVDTTIAWGTISTDSVITLEKYTQMDIFKYSGEGDRTSADNWTLWTSPDTTDTMSVIITLTDSSSNSLVMDTVSTAFNMDNQVTPAVTIAWKEPNLEIKFSMSDLDTTLNGGFLSTDNYYRYGIDDTMPIDSMSLFGINVIRERNGTYTALINLGGTRTVTSDTAFTRLYGWSSDYLDVLWGDTTGYIVKTNMSIQEGDSLFIYSRLYVDAAISFFSHRVKSNVIIIPDTTAPAIFTTLSADTNGVDSVDVTVEGFDAVNTDSTFWFADTQFYTAHKDSTGLINGSEGDSLTSPLTFAHGLTGGGYLWIYVGVEDTLDNIVWSYTAVELPPNPPGGEDTAPPNTVGAFVASYKSVFLDSINTTNLTTDSLTDVAGFKIYGKVNTADSFFLMATITGDTLQDTSLTFSNLFFIIDSGFTKIAAYDSSGNIDPVGLLDTFVVECDTLFATVNEDSVDRVMVLRDSDSTRAGADSSIILWGAAVDTVGHADSSKILIAEQERGAFFTLKQRLLGAWDRTLSAWKWWSPPDSATTFAVEESADADSDSVRITIDVQPTLIDSLQVYYASGAYAFTTRLFSKTDTLPADTTILFPGDAGATYYFSLRYWYNGTSSDQVGWLRPNRDTCAVPEMAAPPAASDSTFYWACENDDDITGGAIPGYNAGGDNTPILAGDISMTVAQSVSGDSSVLGTGVASANYVIGVTASTCSDDSGSIEFKYYMNAFVDEDDLLNLYSSATNRYMRFQLEGTDELEVGWRDDGGTYTLVTNGANLAASQWYTIRCVWDVDATPELSVWVDAYTVTGSPGIATQPSNWTILMVGGAGGFEGYIDDVKIWPYKKW